MHAPIKKLEDIKDHALQHMHRAGYEIKEPIQVEIDKDLPYSGYTTTRNGRTVIVVSAAAIQNESAVNLLIHELSHIYCMQVRHPSHNNEFISTIIGWAVHGQVVHEYQERIIHNIINHLMDLYADDIAFQVMHSHANQLQLSEFFLQWIHEPSKAKDPVQRAWENAETVVSAAFAEASLKRHDIPDTENKIEKAKEKLLATLDKRYIEAYEFYKTFMTYTPEEVEEKAFEKLLIKYISEFLKITKTA